MRRGIGWLAVLSAAWLAPSSVPAQGWETVGTGIEYRQFTLPDPNDVFVARMDRSNLQVTIESSIATGKLASGTETVRGQAARYDQAISYWGQSWGGRNHVVVAINGDFFDASGYPYGGQIHSGWYAKRFGDMGGGSGFAWKIGRQAFIGQCVTHRPWKQYITFVATGITQEFQGINRARTTDDLVIYTPQYDATTLTNNSGVEVVVEMTNPSRIMPPPSTTRGFVREIRIDQGSTYIPFDHVVLSATGTKRTTLLANVHVGDEIGISQEITHYQQDCNTPLALDWTKTFASIGGSFYFLKDGVVPSFSDPGATERHPRTAICLDAANGYVYFVVVDGRRPGVSVGMSMAELGAFARDTLGVTQCLNQDGGGSSTMVVNGAVRNNPSDGSERAVANGMMMVVVEPKQQSTALAPGDPVTAKAATSVRLGPGTNYEPRGSVAKNAAGTVLAHFNGLDGVLAKGSYWWKVDFGSVVGWVPSESITGPRGAVAGTVTDAGTGLPLAAVTVKAWDEAAQQVASATTGANGAYLLEGILPGTRFVTTANTLEYADELYDNLPCDPSCSVTSGNGVGVAAEATTPGIDFALLRMADLAITKTDGQATAIPGQAISYAVVASNAGPSVANGATVTDTVPATITGVSWTCVGAGGGSCTASGAGNISDTVNLPAGGTVTYTLTGTLSGSATGSLSNTVTLGAPSGVTDPNPANNSATDADAVADVADLSIAKTDGQATAVPGSAVTYTIVASNAGPSVASGATVTDAVPAEITGVTWTCVGAGGGSCTASGSGSLDETVDLPAGGTVTYTLTGTVSAAARGTLDNTATIAPPAGVTDPDPADNSATDTDTLLGLGLFTLVPCRVIDTRGLAAPIGGPVLQGQETRSFAVVGYCQIPSTAKALSINVTVTLPSAAGNIRLFPAGLPVPTFSNLNYAAGQTRANNAIVSLNDGGELAAFVAQPAGTTTHLIIDVNGYFE